MSFKKNVFSYVMWAFYVVLALGGLYIGARKLCEGFEQPALSSGIASSVTLLAGGVLAVAACRIRKVLAGRQPGKSVRRLLEALFLAAVAALLYFMHEWPVWSAAEGISDSVYFQAAFVEEGRQIPQITHGIVYLYLHLLHLVFLLFGNKEMTAVLMQFGLHYAGLLALYAGVRKLSGVIPAAVMLFFACISPYMVKEAVTLSPQMLYLLLYGIALWLVAVRIRGVARAPVSCLVTGLILAGMVYLDLSGFTLYLILAAGTLMRASQFGERGIDRVWSLILTFVGMAAGFLLLLALDAKSSGKTFMDIWTVWSRLYKPGDFRIPFTDMPGTYEGLDTVSLLLLSFGIFSFWCFRKTEKLSVWMPAALSVLAASSFGMFVREMDGQMLLRLILYIMSGVSAAQYFGVEQGAAVLRQARSHSKQKAEVIKTAEEQEPAQMREMIQPRELTQPIEPMQSGEPGKVVTVTVRGETKQVKLLDNPLPLPKQHEHRAMDYALKEPEDLDGYDFPVSGEDDFDI